jgi:tRNA A37 methylthiotransferase MiaB
MAWGKILPYLDIPFQHASPKILKAMRRPPTMKRCWSVSANGARFVDLAIRPLHRRLPGETKTISSSR